MGVGFPLALLIAAAGALLGEWAGLIDPAVLRETHQVDFIYGVGAFSFIVVLLAGAVGMLSDLGEAGRTGRSVHLGYHGARGGVRGGGGHCRGMGTAAQSALQLLVNLVGVAFAGVLVLLLRTRRDKRNLGRPLAQG